MAMMLTTMQSAGVSLEVNLRIITAKNILRKPEQTSL